MNDDDNIEDLISQLQDVGAPVEVPREDTQFSLDKEDAEQFVIDNAGKLIVRSLQAVDDIKQYVLSAPDSEQIDSLASLIRSSANAIDTLNKIVLQDMKAATSKELKQIDFEQKKSLQASSQNDMTRALKMSREDMVQYLLKDATLIDAEVSNSEEVDSADDFIQE
jgi:hypothetical protein